MDLKRAFHVQAAEAASTVMVPTAQGDPKKLRPSKAAALMESARQGVRSGGGCADGTRHHGSSQRNVSALVRVDGNKSCSEEGGGSRSLICPECGKAFQSEKAMYGHLRCHPERGYKGATRPAAPATKLMDGVVNPRKKELAMKNRAVSSKEGEHPTKWPVTVRRGRTPTAVAYAVSAPPPRRVLLWSTCSEEEEAAMILLGMSSGGKKLEAGLEPDLNMQQMHAPDAVEGHHMPGLLDQLELPYRVVDSPAMDIVPQMEVDHPMMPEHAAGIVVGTGQQVREAEKPDEVEHIHKVVMEAQEPEVKQALPPELVAMATAASEVETPTELEPVTDAVHGTDRLVFPSTKRPKKRRLNDLVQMLTPAAASAGDEPPVRRIPSPASDRKYGCHLCFKEFSTHQALGGHIAYHNRANKLSAEQQLQGRFAMDRAMHSIMAQRQVGGSNVFIPGAAIGPSVEEHQGLPPPLPAARATVLHPCTQCSMVFATGQALGGHMRRHWLVDNKQTMQAVDAAEGSAAGPRDAPRDFDLNELPKE